MPVCLSGMGDVYVVGWMGRRLCGLVDGRCGGWMGGCQCVWMDRGMHVWVTGWRDACVCGSLEGCASAWMNVRRLCTWVHLCGPVHGRCLCVRVDWGGALVLGSKLRCLCRCVDGRMPVWVGRRWVPLWVAKWGDAYVGAPTQALALRITQTHIPPSTHPHINPIIYPPTQASNLPPKHRGIPPMHAPTQASSLPPRWKGVCLCRWVDRGMPTRVGGWGDACLGGWMGGCLGL